MLAAIERVGESMIDMATTGKSSPMAPYDSMTPPTAVPPSSRSRMMGTSVP